MKVRSAFSDLSNSISTSRSAFNNVKPSTRFSIAKATNQSGADKQVKNTRRSSSEVQTEIKGSLDSIKDGHSQGKLTRTSGQVCDPNEMSKLEDALTSTRITSNRAANKASLDPKNAKRGRTFIGSTYNLTKQAKVPIEAFEKASQPDTAASGSAEGNPERRIDPFFQKGNATVGVKSSAPALERLAARELIMPIKSTSTDVENENVPTLDTPPIEDVSQENVEDNNGRTDDSRSLAFLVEAGINAIPHGVAWPVCHNDDEIGPLRVSSRDVRLDEIMVFDAEGRPYKFCNTLKQPDWLFDYWKSREAHRLMAAKEGETANAAIGRHIAALENVNETTWKSYCEPNTLFFAEEISKHCVMTKATYLLGVLHLAEARLPECASFIECCHQAVAFLTADMSDPKINDASLLYRWFVDFRANHRFKLTMIPDHSRSLNIPFWDSREAQTLFGVKDGRRAKAAVMGYIKELQTFQTNFNDLLIDETFDSLFDIPDKERKEFFTKVVYIVRALANAVVQMPAISWTGCCELACEQLANHKGFKKISSAKTVRGYFREYIYNGQKFSLGTKENPGLIHETEGSINVRYYM